MVLDRNNYYGGECASLNLDVMIPNSSLRVGAVQEVRQGGEREGQEEARKQP